MHSKSTLPRITRFDDVRQDKADKTANEIAEEYVNQRNPTDLAILFWI